MAEGPWKLTPEMRKVLENERKGGTKLDKPITIPLTMDSFYATNRMESTYLLIPGLNVIVPPKSSVISLPNGDIMTVPNMEEK